MNIKKIVPCVFIGGLILSENVAAGLVELKFTTEVERQSALVTLNTYNSLIKNSGCSDSMTDPSSVGTVVPKGAVASCTGAAYQLFTKLRSLVHSANELSGDRASIQYSLHLTRTQLGDALRWVAPEEYSTQDSLTRDFAKNQIAGLTTRLNALRLGAAVNGEHPDQNVALQSLQSTGGGASADQQFNSDSFSQLGGFINISRGEGSKDSTSLENAFRVNNYRVNSGLDFRIDDHWVTGAMLSYSNQKVDFDRNKSVADGEISLSGYAVTPYLLFQSDQFYASANMGLQQLNFDTRRIISYSGTETETRSDSHAQVISYSAEAGYTFQRQQFSVEPFASLNSSTSRIDRFIERDRDNAALSQVVNAQKTNSNTIGVGINFRYVFTPKLGIVIPFTRIEHLTQSNTDKNIVTAYYANSIGDENQFSLPKDTPDSSYQVITFGVSSVLRGSRELTVDGPAVGGVQGFLHYRLVQGLRDYQLSTIEAGLRYEF